MKAKIEVLSKTVDGVEKDLFPLTVTEGVVDPETKKNAKELFEEKADHGYEENPKTLKAVDEEKANHGYASIEVAKTLKEVEDDTSVKMTNLITNGDFSNGVTGWDSQGGILSVMDNELTHTGNNNTTGISLIRQNLKTISNNKYYVAFEIYISDEVSMLYLEQIGGLGTNHLSTRITETWVKAERVISAGGTTSNNITFVARFKNDENGGKLFKLRSVKIINLTETFGVGNEPTKEEMNLLISTLGIDYFEGEITIPSQKIMQWQLAMIRQNKNAIIALGGTII